MLTNKYFIVIFMSAIMALTSTFYIISVQNLNTFGVMFFEFISPLLSFLYLHFYIDAKNIKQRFILAICAGLGYAIGSFLAIQTIL